MRGKFLLLYFLLIGFTAYSQPKTDLSELNKTVRIEKIYPNPVTDFVFVEIESVDYAMVHFELVDIMGNMVQQWDSRQVLPGNQRIRLSINDLHSGLYLLRARVGDENLVFRIRKS